MRLSSHFYGRQHWTLYPLPSLQVSSCTEGENPKAVRILTVWLSFLLWGIRMEVKYAIVR